MATPNRFALRDAGSFTFYRLDGNKEAVVTLNTLKTSGIETSGETVYARGGFGNAKLVGFSSNREAKITLEDAIFDVEALAMITGNEIKRASKDIDAQDILTVDSRNTVTLTKKIYGNPVTVALLNADGTLGKRLEKASSATTGKYSIAGQVITFHTDIPQDTKVKVYYMTKTAVDASSIRVTTDAFGKSFRVVGDIIVRDEFTKQDYAGQIRIPCAKFEDNFSLSLASDGDPATLSLPLEILKDPTSTDMWELVIYDANEVPATISLEPTSVK